MKSIINRLRECRGAYTLATTAFVECFRRGPNDGYFEASIDVLFWLAIFRGEEVLQRVDVARGISVNGLSARWRRASGFLGFRTGYFLLISPALLEARCGAGPQLVPASNMYLDQSLSSGCCSTTPHVMRSSTVGEPPPHSVRRGYCLLAAIRQADQPGGIEEPKLAVNSGTDSPVLF
ncbi:hypothetical protein B0T21DRAFT_393079 [Apiosordaria backusii]|uniref:Uncharacterized protein n=1 Tax=Apiosordaria backusii TaxID=314023 RepID=A0AA40BLB3_9PEZI|nr:hypothetical protein B0T21DRAFT_393079 [Apiosordaria backusii]